MLLTGSTPQLCRAWACAIGDALIVSEAATGPDLMTGDAGIALFLGYLAAATGDERYVDACEARLARAGDTELVDPFLFSGAAGIAWVHEHLCGRILAPNADDVNAATDELVGVVLDAPVLWRGRWELMYGLTGLGVYVLERPDSATRTLLLARIVGALEQCAEIDPDATSWRSFLDRDLAGGSLNLGLAHGACGVIALLSRLVRETAIERGRVEALLRGSVHGLLRTRRPGAAGYPASAGATQPCRVSWCYGDLGAAVALDAAATALHEPSWRTEARDAALRCARRDVAGAMVADSGLCHGSIGLAHLFRRLHARLDEPELADAADRWLTHAVAARIDGAGIAGVCAWSAPDRTWTADPGLLGGAAGVGLGLLTLGGLVDASWDRVLAIS